MLECVYNRFGIVDTKSRIKDYNAYVLSGRTRASRLCGSATLEIYITLQIFDAHTLVGCLTLDIYAPRNKRENIRGLQISVPKMSRLIVGAMFIKNSIKKYIIFSNVVSVNVRCTKRNNFTIISKYLIFPSFNALDALNE